MTRTESREMYLEVIYDIYMQQKEIRSIDVAKILDYSKPSVNRGINLLKNDNLIEQEPYGSITLTPKGLKIAKKIKSRHIDITAFLEKSLGLDSETAEQDACRIEHIISEKAMEKIRIYLDQFDN